MPLIYNPVVKKGLFRVTSGKRVKSYRAVDKAEARWKFQQRFMTRPSVLLQCDVLEPTIRENGPEEY